MSNLAFLDKNHFLWPFSSISVPISSFIENSDLISAATSFTSSSVRAANVGINLISAILLSIVDSRRFESLAINIETMSLKFFCKSVILIYLLLNPFLYFWVITKRLHFLKGFIILQHSKIIRFCIFN